MKRYRFEAQIEEGRGGGAWVSVPLDVEKEFGTRGQVKVKARFDGVPYRGSIAPMGGGRHVLGIRTAIRAAIGKGVGDRVTVALARDEEERVVQVPLELQRLFRNNHAARMRFKSFSYSHQREYAEHVAEAKKPETRERRARKACDHMLRK